MASPQDIEKLLHTLDVGGHHQTGTYLNSLGALGVPTDLLHSFVQQLATELDATSEQERILASVVRFLEASRSPSAWLALFEREGDALKTLVRLFAISQYVADLLIADPEAFDLLRMTQGQPVKRDYLVDELLAEVEQANDERSVLRILREYRHRETLRIAYGDFIGGQTIDVVTEQISILAEAIIEAACHAARKLLAPRWPAPKHANAQPIKFAVLALGKLGGGELNYASDVDLIFLREDLSPQPAWQKASAKPAAVDDYFDRLGRLVIRLLTEVTEAGLAYRVDMRLRPHGRSGPLVVRYSDGVGYYDSSGRTWERQAFIKARSVAGDKELGETFIEQLQPWVYRRYLMRADITGIAALKRRIEQRAVANSGSGIDVKLGKGGIRDVEYAVQFLQLLHGAENSHVRSPSTLVALHELQLAGCLTAEEEVKLSDNYRFLRQVEHLLQIKFDRQTHSLPSNEQEFLYTAEQIPGIADGDPATDFRRQLQQRTSQNHQILEHLLHNAFSSEQQDGLPEACLESDLILDPEPSTDTIEAALHKYGFRDCQAAYAHLQELSVESIRFLSTRRSRHFLAAIAPQLLQAISETPDPDATLISLAHVSASLGGKAVLWELFSANPPSMELCVRLCATSPYLAGILTSNPGMIDELLDSLMLPKLPTLEELSQLLEDLCRGAVDIDPMLHSFKNSMHLRVGVRDILGMDSIVETHRALSNVAEVCMEHVIDHEFHRLVHQLGVPICRDESGHEAAAEFVVLAVGKLGGKEPNYHSDLDVIFLFEDAGQTKSLVPNRRFEPTTNRHFFNQLAQRVIRSATQIGSSGKLYDLDVRLRPLGRSGQLAITIQDLRNYFKEGKGQIWERQALCKSRPIWGSVAAQAKTMNCVFDVLVEMDNAEEVASSIFRHRMQLEQGASPGNLKRGLGGTMDIEFMVQFWQLLHVREQPTVLAPGTLEALDHLHHCKLISDEMHGKLKCNYQFLRSIESGIRLMDLSARHEIPKEPDQLEKLAFLLRSEKRSTLTGPELAASCEKTQAENRECFLGVFGPHLPGEVENAETASEN